MLYFFCGVEVLATITSLLLSQQKYVIDLMSKHNMLGSKLVSTPLVIGTYLAANMVLHRLMYCQVVGDPQHLRMTQLDISFIVNKFSQFLHMSFKHHWGEVKHLLRYLNGTRSLGI